MRRLLAIFFLFTVLLNTAGYYLVLEGWKWHNSLTWTFDDNSATPELIVRIPFEIPYATEDEEWQKAQGQFEYEGEMYRIVKQKLTLEGVYIALVKDQEGSMIIGQQEDFAKSFSDKPADAKQGAKTLPVFLKEYLSDRISLQSSVNGWSMATADAPATENLVPSYCASIIHPPENSIL